MSKSPTAAIVCRGPLRTPIEHLERRIDSLRDEFTAAGVKTRVFLATWNEPFCGLDKIAFSARFDDVLLVQQPTEEEIVEMIGQTTLADHRFGVRNTFYQYFLSRLAMATVDASGEYDYIVHTRTDLDISLGQFMPDWLSRPDLYATIHCREDNAPFINDQFAIASQKVMVEAWSYRSLDELRSFFATAVIPEDILQSILTSAGVTARQVLTTQWTLDPARGSPHQPVSPPPESEPVVEAEPTPDMEAMSEAEPVLNSEFNPESEVVQSEPELIPRPEPVTEAEVPHEAAAAPELVLEPEPEAEPETVKDVQASEPEGTPADEAASEPKVVAEVQPVAHEMAYQVETAPESEREPEPISEPEPLPEAEVPTDFQADDAGHLPGIEARAGHQLAWTAEPVPDDEQGADRA